LGDYFPAASQLQAGQPLSRTIFHFPSASRRQTELNVPVRLPEGSRTGPDDKARMPLAQATDFPFCSIFHMGLCPASRVG